MQNLLELKAAIENFPHCDLKRGVKRGFSAGSSAAKIMIIGGLRARRRFWGIPFVGAPGGWINVIFDRIKSRKE